MDEAGIGYCMKGNCPAEKLYPDMMAVQLVCKGEEAEDERMGTLRDPDLMVKKKMKLEGKIEVRRR